MVGTKWHTLGRFLCHLPWVLLYTEVGRLQQLPEMKLLINKEIEYDIRCDRLLQSRCGLGFGRFGPFLSQSCHMGQCPLRLMTENSG